MPDFQVAYCTLCGAEASHDRKFGANLAYFLLFLGILLRLPTLAAAAQYAAVTQLPQTYSLRMR